MLVYRESGAIDRGAEGKIKNNAETQSAQRSTEGQLCVYELGVFRAL
jgi:hypothetical protein